MGLLLPCRGLVREKRSPERLLGQESGAGLQVALLWGGAGQDVNMENGCDSQGTVCLCQCVERGGKERSSTCTSMSL